MRLILFILLASCVKVPDNIKHQHDITHEVVVRFDDFEIVYEMCYYKDNGRRPLFECLKNQVHMYSEEGDDL